MFLTFSRCVFGRLEDCIHLGFISNEGAQIKCISEIQNLRLMLQMEEVHACRGKLLMNHVNPNVGRGP